MRLKFVSAAADAYEGVADDEVLDKLDAVFDELEKDPGKAWLRRHRWSDPPLWGVTVHGRREDVLVLWAVESVDGEQVVVVHYVGPDVPL
jgi:hypothetical protein